MTTDVADAVIHFATTGGYPDDEAIIARELNADILSDLLNTLRKARADVRKEVQAVSRTTGSNVEQWITLAKELQNDIQRSRAVARSIVEENETTDKLKEEVRDTAGKIRLLEKELEYEGALEDTLQRIRHANGILIATQDLIVKGDVAEALKTLRSARAAVTALNDASDIKAVAILDARGRQLKSSIEEAVSQMWAKLIQVDTRQGTVVIRDQLPDDNKASLDLVASAAQDSGILQRLVQKLSKEFDRAVTQKVLSTVGGGKQVSVLVKSSTVELQYDTTDKTGEKLSAFLTALFDFLASQLPEPVREAFVKLYLPVLVNKLEEKWLEPSIPTNISQLQAFSQTIDQVDKLAAQLDVLGWPGAQQLKDWTDDVPKAWLTKRREVLLGTARDIVFEKLHETRTVQRVETRVISGGGNGEPSTSAAEDDWDTAWDEPDDEQKAQGVNATSTEQKHDEDEDSAWDVEDPATNDDHPQAEEEAWGWDDEGGQEKQSVPSSPAHSRTKTPHAANDSSNSTLKQQTQTLSETYSTTAIPEELFSMIEAVIEDAQRLAGAEYSASRLSQAATGLYSLPTLALAIYRATAPTAYSKLPAGNMMIYSDSTRLSELLRDWQSSQPAASRLRLDKDVKALDDFARRAYSAELEAQRTVMRDLLDDAQGFSNCTQPPFKAACEGAVEQAVDRLHDVNKMWKSILPPSALPQVVGQLLATLTGKMIRDIEELSDISEPESQQLKALCERVTAVKSLFTHETPEHGSRDMTFVYCPNWLKFQYLAEILESSLADIRYLWNEGELSLEFEADAVIDLVKALFAESDKRRQAINEIKRGGRR